MKVMHVVGNRPQFIKLAPVSREMRKRNIEEIIIHTGQHYDKNMSDIFFEELGIPKPTRNLNVGSGSHAQTTAKAMIALEEVMTEYNPQCVIIYGDTNSTLAAALTAAKLCIPMIHVEAGIRTNNKKNPEECNRIVADHLSGYLCTPDRISVDNLKQEGIDEKKIHFTGDVMFDEFLYCASQENASEYLKKYPKDYILMTWHRQENTDSREKIKKIIDFIEQVKYPIVLPLHPRTKKKIVEYGFESRIQKNSNLIITEPVGYLEMVSLLKNCKCIITDSGGASKEASFAGKRCIFLLDLEVWPELIESGWIQILNFKDANSVKTSMEIISAAINSDNKKDKGDFFGDGNAAEKIVDIVEMILN